MTVLYIVILIYFNFNITSIVNVFMLSIEKKIILYYMANMDQIRLKIVFCNINGLSEEKVPDDLFSRKIELLD